MGLICRELYTKYIRDTHDEVLNVYVGKHGARSTLMSILKLVSGSWMNIIKELIPFVDYVNSIEGLDNFSVLRRLLSKLLMIKDI